MKLTSCKKGTRTFHVPPDGELVRPGWVLRFPYNPEFLILLKRDVPHTGRAFESADKTWWVADDYEDMLDTLFENFKELAVPQGTRFYTEGPKIPTQNSQTLPAPAVDQNAPVSQETLIARCKAGNEKLARVPSDIGKLTDPAVREQMLEMFRGKQVLLKNLASLLWEKFKFKECLYVDNGGVKTRECMSSEYCYACPPAAAGMYGRQYWEEEIFKDRDDGGVFKDPCPHCGAHPDSLKMEGDLPKVRCAMCHKLVFKVDHAG